VLELRGLSAGYGHSPGTARHHPGRTHRLGGGTARPQRRRQDHDDAGGGRPVGTPVRTAVGERSGRHRGGATRTGEARGLPRPEGRGVFPGLTVRENIIVQSRRGQEDQAIAIGRGSVPDHRPAVEPGGRNHVRRRAADARVGQGLRAIPDHRAARRGQHGPGPRSSSMRSSSFLHPLGGGRREPAAGRAVRDQGAGPGRLRVPCCRRARSLFAGEPGELDGEDLFARYPRPTLPDASKGPRPTPLGSPYSLVARPVRVRR